MLPRTRPGSVVSATLLAASIAACSSDSDDTTADVGATHSSALTDSGGTSATADSDTTANSGVASGGAQGSGGSINGSGATDTTDSTDTSTSGGAGGSPGGAGGSPGGAGAPSDEPYANVVAVAASGSEGSYTFNVSVESADVDCSQFADWWEVVGEDGTLLYRRILEHSHTDANGTSDADAPGNTFTRSGGPVNVLTDDVVIVRAHMSNLDAYNGTAMRGSVALGFMVASDLDPAFAANLESVAPQPEACLF